MKIFFCCINSNIIKVFLLFLTVHAWADADLNKTKLLYQSHDQGQAKEGALSLVGLRVSALVSNNKLAEAKELLNKELPKPTAPQEIINWGLAKIAAQEGKWSEFRKYFIASRMGSLQNVDLVSGIYDSLPTRQKNWLVARLVEEQFFTRRPQSSCPYFELTARKKRAEFLYTLVKNHHLPKPLHKELFYELYVLIPEAVSSSSLKSLSGFNPFLKQLKNEDLAVRMENLLTFGKNNEARETFAESLMRNKKSSEAPCELDYIDAKVDRKLRKYAVARARFAEQAKKCPQDTQLKARYMDLMLATTLADEASLPNFDAFVTDYPTHSFADDVLVFKASMLLDKGRIDEGLASLARVIEQYPQGDMINRAYFLQGFTWAKMGNTQAALTSFAELKKRNAPESLDFAQSAYWHARLSIAPDTASLKTKKPSLEVIKALEDLVYAQKPTVYSWLAQSLLEVVHKKPGIKPTVVPEDAPLVNFLDNKNLSLIRRSIVHGFRDEALALLLDLSVGAQEVAYAQEVAIYYDVLNRPEAAHQQLVRCNRALRDVLAAKIPKTIARISYPLAFAREVEKSTQQFDVPQEVVFAIMRQESGFIPDSCSWAGAKGLMQLMYPSALSQAKSAAISNLTENDLYSPSVNILLATSLLKKYWQQFGSLALALAAYNAGPSMARSWLNKNPAVPLDTLIENISFKETRDYVKSVLGATFTYMNHSKSKNPPRLELVLK